MRRLIRSSISTKRAALHGVDGVGCELSTLKVVLGTVAAEVLPALSLAVAAPMLIPGVPSPVTLLTVTIRVVPAPLTPIEPRALLVVLSVTWQLVSEITSAPLKVTVYVTCPVVVSGREVAPIKTVGAVLAYD